MAEVTKELYMTEITTYPNGSKFIRSWFVGNQKAVNKEFVEKKQEKAEAEKQKKIDAEQVKDEGTIRM